MTPKELVTVEAASKRERAHWFDGHHCLCTTCVADRVTVAAAAPWLLAYVSEGRATPRKGTEDFGDLG